MSRIKILLLLILMPSVSLFAQESTKKNLTYEQIITLPKGIIESVPFVTDWIDNDTFAAVERVNGKLNSFSVNIKSGLTAPYTKEIKHLSQIRIEGAVNPTFSPDSTKIAFTRGNDLYALDIMTGKETRYTFDGSELILNGYASWVYYEEILGRGSRYKSFWWSPDSKQLAFYRYDNTNVPMFPIYDAAGLHGTLTETRYPKAGDPNPTVKIGLVNIDSFAGDDSIVWADFNDLDDQYFGIPYWSGNSQLFIVPWMPREQNEMIVYKIEPATGAKHSIYTEKQSTWIDWIERAWFTDKGMYMVRDFEMWEQIYYLSYDGSVYQKLTDGENWGVNILKVDEKAGLLFFTAHRESPTTTDVYRLSLKKKGIERVSFGEYTFTSVMVSPDNKHYIASYSNVDTPTQTALVTMGKRGITTKLLYDSKGSDFDKYKIATAKMLSITTDDGFVLPCAITLPVDMDSTKKYPVIFSIYGGPNAPQVSNRWKNPSKYNQWWANEGVIQITVDCRTAGHSGKRGMNFAHRHLGHVEIQDFILWAKYLGTLPYVNPEKIGITGFSFGGTTTLLALTEGSEYFKYGIAGGGVYDWALYDSHYGERYMDLPEDNKDGYALSNVMNKIDKYIGDESSMLRITHGTSDDNVHFQNTLQLVSALQNRGKVFELMIYPGEYHGYRGEKRRHSDNADMEFWYRYLLDKKPPMKIF